MIKTGLAHKTNIAFICDFFVLSNIGKSRRFVTYSV